MQPFDRTYDIDLLKSFPAFAYARSFQRIQALLDSQKLVDAHLAVLNEEIQRRTAEFRPADPAYSEAQALYDILRLSEDDGGFVKDQVKYVTGVLPVQSFLQMMEGPYAFMDPFVTKRHGAETHRIQWWMIARDLRDNSAEYDIRVDPGKLFASTRGVDASHSAEDNVWYHSLDALQGKCTTARAPESLKDHILAHFPQIAAAEEQQMSWNSCVKWRYEVMKTLSVVARGLEKNQELKRYP